MTFGGQANHIYTDCEKKTFLIEHLWKLYLGN